MRAGAEGWQAGSMWAGRGRRVFVDGGSGRCAAGLGCSGGSDAVQLVQPFLWHVRHPFSLRSPLPPLPRRRRQKENQEDLLQRVNQATLDMLNKGGGGSGGGGGQGRRITDIVAYKSPSDMQHNNSLTVQVDHRSECVLVPIYGMLVPFHILTVKNASNNQVRWRAGAGGRRAQCSQWRAAPRLSAAQLHEGMAERQQCGVWWPCMHTFRAQPAACIFVCSRAGAHSSISFPPLSA